MKILKSIIDKIDNLVADHPSETGGILGSSNSEYIDEVVMDLPNPYTSRSCSYSPNVAFFNQNIELWQSKDITFKGVFHTHYFGVKSLSCGDKKYITEIMRGLPKCVGYLYFPVFVLPERELICYKAVRTNDSIFIEEEPLVLME